MTLRMLLVAALLAVCTAAVAAAPVGVRVEHAWIRWLPANLPQAGYATIVNDSDAPVRLTGASSPDYGMVMLHQSRLAQGDSTMVHVDRLEIPAHGRAVLSPGGYHLMLSDPTHAIKPGDTARLSLQFAGDDSLQVDFSVRPANASGP